MRQRIDRVLTHRVFGRDLHRVHAVIFQSLFMWAHRS